MLFLIWSDLLNCIKSFGTMVITTECGSNSLKVIFTKQILTKVTIFCCFDVCCVRPSQLFQVQAIKFKISTVRPLIPDYLSVSYDYSFSHFATYFMSL